MEETTKYFWCNCFIFAIYMWFTRGGYFVIRRAHSNIPYPHFMWKPKKSKNIYHFVPKDDFTFPWIVFRGYVRKGDWDDL